MSRIGNQPVPVPGKVTVTVEGQNIHVQGPKGELRRELPRELRVSLQDKVITIARTGDEPRIRALHGLYRAIIRNMVMGVSDGFTKRLELHGVGYRAVPQGKDLQLQLGYSKPVLYQAPTGITLGVEGAEKVLVSGIDKQLVGQVAAEIRSIRPVEPYKGKGVRYAGEQVRRKAGKAAKAKGAAAGGKA